MGILNFESVSVEAQMYVRDTRTTLNQPVTSSNATDIENARAIAKRIFETYDRDRNGFIDAYEIGSMMTDAYKTINKAFSPSKADVDSYIRVLDRNGDGKVSLPDIEQIVFRFLLGEDYTSRLSGGGGAGAGPGPYVPPERTGTRGGGDPFQAFRETARRVFTQYDRDRSGFVDGNEIYPMITDIYRELNMGFIPNRADIDTFMNTFDSNRDGRISYAEFEQMVIRLSQLK
eukprot:TRINITY_DN3656_c0_g2_i1.p2 TRINITY_DN3656_c0_g2~~TRINITY_DN3656_c0_g2_i1.p2  ORF type:complete len:231 (+),score=57.77 TRINITY_DN3656_c0_g2_i1:100-792(+)